MKDSSPPPKDPDVQHEQAEQEDVTAPKKKLIRWWGLGLLAGLIILGVIGAELGFSQTVRSILKSSLTDQNLTMADGTQLSASLLGGSVAIDDLRVRDEADSEPRFPYQSKELRIDVATFATLFGEDYIIQRLASEGSTFDFRRRQDGSIPGVPSDSADDSSDATQPTDLFSLAHELHEKWKKLKEYDWVLEKIPTGSENQATPAVEWSNAVYYAPPEPAPTADTPPARIFIRELLFRGAEVALPNKIGNDPTGSPLDIRQFEMNGENVSLTLRDDELMTLNAVLVTNGAGQGDFNISRQVSTGEASLEWQGFPLQLLTDPQLAGDQLGDFQAKGSLNIRLNPKWNSSTELSGMLTFEFIDLELQGGSSQVQQATRHMKQMGINNIVWELPISGTLADPRIDELSLDHFIKTILKSTTDALKDKAEEVVDTVVEEGTKEVQEAVQDEVNDLLNKDRNTEKKEPEERLKDVESKLKDRFGF